MNKKLYVGNLLYETTDDELKQIFGQAGTVVSATIIRYQDTGRSKGFGFVEMSTPEEAKMHLIRIPRKPHGFSEIIRIKIGEIHNLWLRYLGLEEKE